MVTTRIKKNKTKRIKGGWSWGWSNPVGNATKQKIGDMDRGAAAVALKLQLIAAKKTGFYGTSTEVRNIVIDNLLELDRDLILKDIKDTDQQIDTLQGKSQTDSLLAAENKYLTLKLERLKFLNAAVNNSRDNLFETWDDRNSGIYYKLIKPWYTEYKALARFYVILNKTNKAKAKDILFLYQKLDGELFPYFSLSDIQIIGRRKVQEQTQGLDDISKARAEIISACQKGFLEQCDAAVKKYIIIRTPLVSSTPAPVAPPPLNLTAPPGAPPDDPAAAPPAAAPPAAAASDAPAAPASDAAPAPASDTPAAASAAAPAPASDTPAAASAAPDAAPPAPAFPLGRGPRQSFPSMNPSLIANSRKNNGGKYVPVRASTAALSRYFNTFRNAKSRVPASGQPPFLLGSNAATERSATTPLSKNMLRLKAATEDLRAQRLELASPKQQTRFDVDANLQSSRRGWRSGGGGTKHKRRPKKYNRTRRA